MNKERTYSKLTVLTITLIIAIIFLHTGIAYAASGSSKFDPQAQTPQPIQSTSNPYPYTGSQNILLIQDVTPWGMAAGGSPYGAVVDELLAQKKLFCMITSSELGATDLSPFRDIIIASAQTQAFYDNLFPGGVISQKIVDFVNAGGTLSANLADFASGPGNDGNWSKYTFVAGVKKTYYLSNDNSIADSSHPVIADMLPCLGHDNGPIVDSGNLNDIDGWGSSSHGYFTNLPVDTWTILTTLDAAGAPQPVFIEYAYGSGKVIATMNTLEWMYIGTFGNDHPNKKLLANEICYQSPAVLPVGGTLVQANRLSLLVPSMGLMFVAGAIIVLGSKRKEKRS